MRAGPLGLIVAFCGTASFALASPVTPGTLEFSTTSQSIGLEWEVNGDTDHDAVCDIQYRTAGEATWRPAMSLVRVDSANGNTLAGSILFAAANTEYEVQLSLSDPDGGADIRTIQVLLGHRSIRTTQLYAQVSKRHIARTKSPLDLLGTNEGEFLG